MARKKSSSNQYPCMVLCNGTSKRFGSNKMLADLVGKPLLMHTIENIMPYVSDLALNGELDAEYDVFNLPVFPDAITERLGKLGPLAGVLTAMEWAKELGCMRVLTLSGDAPFVPDDWAEKLSQTPDDIIAIPNVDGQNHQICGLWPVALASDLRLFLQAGESYRVKDFLAVHRMQIVAFHKQGVIDPFFNVNTREDMKVAEQILAARDGHMARGT